MIEITLIMMNEQETEMIQSERSKQTPDIKTVI